MKHTLPLLALLLALLPASAQEAAPLLNHSGPVVSAPDLKSPLGPEWTATKGKWTPEAGVLTGAEVPEDHHAAVLHLATGPRPLIVECEFQFDGAGGFYVGCDGAKHVGRLVITRKTAKLCEDSTEVKGKTPSHTLAETATDLKPGEWQRLRVEYAGDRLTARLNDQELQAQHPYLATPKVRWWFAVGGASVHLRNVRVTEGQPKP